MVYPPEGKGIVNPYWIRWYRQPLKKFGRAGKLILYPA